VRFSLPTMHLIARFGRNEDGIIQRENLLRSVKRIIELGSKNIDLCMDSVNYRSEQFDNRIMEKILWLKGKHQLSFTAHLPFIYTDISALDEGIREVSVKNIISTINVTKSLGVEVFVLHALGSIAHRFLTAKHPNQMKKKAIIDFRNDILEQANKSIKTICDYIEPERIAIENLPYAPIEIFVSIAEQNGCSYCFDVGHSILIDNDPINFIKENFHNIAIIHLHDVVRSQSGEIFDHQALGKGFAPIKEILALCEKVNLNAPIVIENLNEQTAVLSLQYLKNNNIVI